MRRILVLWIIKLLSPKVRYKKIVPDAMPFKMATDGSAGYDIYVCRVLDKKTRQVISNLEEPLMIEPGESVLFGTGLALEIPPNLYATVVSRSGLSIEKDNEVGSPGAPFDSDFRGEFRVLIRNFGREPCEVGRFMRVAQLLYHPRIVVRQVEVERLSETKRGENGLGSTGFYEIK